MRKSSFPVPDLCSGEISRAFWISMSESNARIVGRHSGAQIWAPCWVPERVVHPCPSDFRLQRHQRGEYGVSKVGLGVVRGHGHEQGLASPHKEGNWAGRRGACSVRRRA